MVKNAALLSRIEYVPVSELISLLVCPCRFLAGESAAGPDGLISPCYLLTGQIPVCAALPRLKASSIGLDYR